jgi:hypothetical protein
VMTPRTENRSRKATRTFIPASRMLSRQQHNRDDH